MWARLKNYFFTGILVTAPVVITFWIVISLINLFDRLITPVIPYYLNPNFYLPRDVPGLGLIVLILFMVVIGMVVHLYFIMLNHHIHLVNNLIQYLVVNQN